MYPILVFQLSTSQYGDSNLMILFFKRNSEDTCCILVRTLFISSRSAFVILLLFWLLGVFVFSPGITFIHSVYMILIRVLLWLLSSEINELKTQMLNYKNVKSLMRVILMSITHLLFLIEIQFKVIKFTDR